MESGILSAITAVIASVATYFATKNNNKKDIKISERQILSQDYIKLIGELKEMAEQQRAEIEGLRREIRDLQAVNIQLMLENQDLQIQIKNLNEKLSKFNNMN